MVAWLRAASALLVAAGPACLAAPIAYEPVGLEWSAEEVERQARSEGGDLLRQASRAGRLGCRGDCERYGRVFERLVAQGRQQTTRSAALPWSLTVVNLPSVDAQVVSGGQILVSEAFADRLGPGDDALAFVLAHEMAHDILEHERQGLSFARYLLPRQPARTVRDMHVELQFNRPLRRAMTPVMHQGEFEADELGFMMASAAGYSPEGQLAFLDQECRADEGRAPASETHPPACARLAALRALLPLAQRQQPAASATPGGAR